MFGMGVPSRPQFSSKSVAGAALVALLSCSQGTERGELSYSPLMATSARAAELSAPKPASARRSKPAAAHPAAPVPPRGAPPAPPEFFAGTLLLQDDILRELSRARFLTFRPVGKTSVVFRSSLESPLRAAFKVATGRRPAGATAEIAAYRLSRCLGVANVPPALHRRVSRYQLRTGLESGFLAQWPALEQRLLVAADGFVDGAAIYWIEGLRDLGLEPPREAARVLAWLQLGAEIPAEKRPLAGQLSTLFAFDYLIGNWDRWSGGNLKGDDAGDLVYMRDHDSAFATKLGEGLQRRMLEPTRKTERYSRSFIDALVRLTPEAYARELALDPGLVGRNAVDPRAIAGVFDRRATLLSRVAALVDEHGEAAILAFP